MSIMTYIDNVSGKRRFKRVWFALIVLVFISLIIVPSMYVLLDALFSWDSLGVVFGDPTMMGHIWGAIGNSFSIAFIVTILDIIVGLPLAWALVRKEFPGKKYLDTLIDMPLVFPTAALGMSVAMFWAFPNGATIPGLGIVLSPYVLIILLHLIFTFPYMVRCLSGILEQIDPTYETAGMTLGASKFTAVRTITLPLFRAGIITGFILCFARSLSETGGTYIALQMMGVESEFFTGPSLINFLKNNPTDPMVIGGDATPYLIVISALLIILAIVLLVVAKYLMNRIHVPFSKVWPKWERRISRGLAVKAKDGFSYVFLLVIILIPSFFIFSYIFVSGGAVDYGTLLSSIGLSFLIAGVAVIFDVIFGIPMAIYIARNSHTRLGQMLDTLINIPLIIPTVALGFSLGLFWALLPMSVPGIILVMLGHIAFTYPLMVRNIIGAVEEVDPSYEEVARSLGAKPLQAFRKVLFPIIQSSVIAGGILAFTRSLGETGATVAIDGTVQTTSIYIMDLISKGLKSEAAMASIVLIIICFIFMFAVRYITRKKNQGV